MANEGRICDDCPEHAAVRDAVKRLDKEREKHETETQDRRDAILSKVDALAEKFSELQFAFGVSEASMKTSVKWGLGLATAIAGILGPLLVFALQRLF